MTKEENDYKRGKSPILYDLSRNEEAAHYVQNLLNDVFGFWRPKCGSRFSSY